jgi:hypothetical protein
VSDIKWLHAVVIKNTDSEAAIGPFVENGNAELIAIQACSELGLEWDGEHMCSEGHVYQAPDEITLPYVRIDSHEINDPFIGLIWETLKKAAVDGWELEAQEDTDA